MSADSPRDASDDLADALTNRISLVGNEEEGWNVEVQMSGKTVVFACVSRDAAEDLLSQIDECSWFQIEVRS